MTVHERLDRIFRDVFDVDGEIDDAVTAADIEDWDSLTHVTLMFAIEQEFGIQFAGNEFATLDNVGALRRQVEMKVGIRTSASED